MAVWICDLDGTICDISHRLHFIKPENRPPDSDWHAKAEEFKADWDSFSSACTLDKPIEDVIDLVKILSRTYLIVVLTGRTEDIRGKTKDWLCSYHIPYSRLYMRKLGDYRPDTIVKSELLDQVYKEFGEDSVKGVFEDRSSVVAMFRARGLRVYQVTDGAF